MRYHPIRAAISFATLLTVATSPSALAQTPHHTRNVVLVVSDGLRWQEIFEGADSQLMNRKFGHVEDTAALRREFSRDDASSARAALFPFIWNVVAKQGEIFGNRTMQSEADVTNGFKFSYPGYNEILTGAPDPRIDSNEFGPNPNVSVFEWMNGQAGFEGRVGVVAGWTAFDRIFNRPRSHLDMRIGWETPWNVDLALTHRYISAVTQEDAPLNRIDRHLPHENYFDLFGSWTVTDQASVRLGINNILDNDPSINSSVGTTGNGNTYPQVYDALGRFIFAGVTVKL